MIKITINKLLPALNENKLSIDECTYIGIDFGTSTTVVSIASYRIDEEKPIKVETLELRQTNANRGKSNSRLFPSILAKYGELNLAGQGALEVRHELKADINLFHSFKMGLGKNVGAKYHQSEIPEIKNDYDATKLFFRVLIGAIKTYVEENGLPEEIKYACSIPASFEANQRKELVKCLEFNNVVVYKRALIDEPNAAFTSYVAQSDNEETINIYDDENTNLLVFDFGAGTCDISILEIGGNAKGVYSKNIAISKFKELGGNQIDQLIAIDILAPQLFSGTDYTLDSFNTRDQKRIIKKLLKSAETLKIKICESIAGLIALDSLDNDLPNFAFSDNNISIEPLLEVDTRKGSFRLDIASITYKEFAKIVEVFTSKNECFNERRINNEEEFLSVFNPISSALKKANLNSNEIDYVLYIGGSAKNPYIQKAVYNYFTDAEHLIPNDLQTHVSNGTAIHSLLLHKFNKNLIQPIISEPIILVVKENEEEREINIIEAGQQIPSELQMINSLIPQQQGQKQIQLPICVSNKEKMLFNLKVDAPDIEGFDINTPIKILAEINADKILNIKAVINNQSWFVEPLFPYDNKELNSNERIAKEAERKYNDCVHRNGGQPTYECLNALYLVYQKLGMYLKAAEHLELIDELFNKGNIHNIGVFYSNVGKNDKALKFYEKAFKREKSAATAFGIARTYKYSNVKMYREYLEKALELDENHNPSLYCLGKILKNEGNIDRGSKLLEKAYKNWENKLANNKMRNSDYGWFSSCAEELGKTNMVVKINKINSKEDNVYYDLDSLVSIKKNNLKH